MTLALQHAAADPQRTATASVRARPAVPTRRPADTHELLERRASQLPGRTGVRRACSCGGTPGPDGECAACKAKRLQAQADVMRQGVAPTAPVPTAGTVTPQGCTTTQETAVRAAVSAARTWMDDIEPKVTAFAAGTAAAPVATVVSGAISTNFHTTVPADISTIAAGFTSLRSRLNGNINFECASSFWCDPNDLAYVRGGTAGIRRLFDVNLCPRFFTCSNPLKTTGTIIHEVAHQSPGATDNAYEWETTYPTLSAASAINNAESYAVAARQIYHSGAHGPGVTC